MTHERPRTQWRQVAGPDLDLRSFHAATVPDGENGWSSSAYEERRSPRNRALLVAHFAKPSRPKMATGGGELARGICDQSRAAALIATIPADLSIPPFLKRGKPKS